MTTVSNFQFESVSPSSHYEGEHDKQRNEDNRHYNDQTLFETSTGEYLATFLNVMPVSDGIDEVEFVRDSRHRDLNSPFTGSEKAVPQASTTLAEIVQSSRKRSLSPINSDRKRKKLVRSPPGGRWPCPYNIADPETYPNCKCYADMGRLKDHIQRSHLKSHQCLICGDRFGCEWGLDRHRKSHDKSCEIKKFERVPQKCIHLSAYLRKDEGGGRLTWGQIWVAIFHLSKHPPRSEYCEKPNCELCQREIPVKLRLSASPRSSPSPRLSASLRKRSTPFVLPAPDEGGNFTVPGTSMSFNTELSYHGSNEYLNTMNLNPNNGLCNNQIPFNTTHEVPLKGIQATSDLFSSGFESFYREWHWL